jgi:serine/threonine-protein kinase
MFVQPFGPALAERFRPLAVLGGGAASVVYDAVRRSDGLPVALKVLDPTPALAEVTRLRFRREGRVVRRLGHPSIVRLYECGETPDGVAWLAFERLYGRTLADVLLDGPMAPARVVALLVPVLGALDEAHRLGIVHRDIKPANLMLVRDDDGERLKVLDFGVAREPDPDPDMTGHGGLVGTPKYMAPEQVRGDAVDGRADVYAVGLVAYALLAGHPAFDSPSVFEDLEAQVRRRPPPLSPSLDVPLALQRVVARALEKHPARRFPTAAAMAAALAASLPAAATPAPQPCAP